MKATSAVARLIFICCVCLVLVGLSSEAGLAAANGKETVADMLNQTGKDAKQPAGTQEEGTMQFTSPSGWTILVQVIFSLGLIVLIIYLLLRFLANKQIGVAGRNGGMKVISAVPLGNGKTVQIVQIGDSLYIVGVGETISLLRHIPAGDEMDTILADAEMAPLTGKWDELLAKWKRKKSNDVYAEELQTSRTFDEMLDQQWDEVEKGSRMELWKDEEQHSKGDRL
ncbi:MAG: flagellar biosynthetic protein FliO [Clostridia bacterium]